MELLGHALEEETLTAQAGLSVPERCADIQKSTNLQIKPWRLQQLYKKNASAPDMAFYSLSLLSSACLRQGEGYCSLRPQLASSWTESKG